MSCKSKKQIPIQPGDIHLIGDFSDMNFASGSIVEAEPELEVVEQYKDKHGIPEQVESSFFSKWAFYSFILTGICLIVYQALYLLGVC